LLTFYGTSFPSDEVPINDFLDEIGKDKNVEK